MATGPEHDVATATALARIGAYGAFLGAPLLLLATFAHPMRADPNDPMAAFAEYAADAHWLWSHIGQLFGAVALLLAVVGVVATWPPGRAAAWGWIGVALAVCATACTGVLQAVDGIALKSAVDHWSGLSGDARLRAFEAALAVRRIEIGLASVVGIFTALTACALSIALLSDSRRPAYLAAIGLVSRAGLLVAAMVQGKAGFSPTAMALSMTSSAVFLLWLLLLGHMIRSRIAPNGARALQENQ